MTFPTPLPLSREWEYARRQLEEYFADLYTCCVETGVGLGVAEGDYLDDYWAGLAPDSCQYLGIVLTDGTVKFSFDDGLTWIIVYDPSPPPTPQTSMLMPYAGNETAPVGWLIADGQAVNRVTYADLFTAIGTTYGVGDGVNTFNLPDLRGRIISGVNDSTLPNGANGSFTTRARAATFGAELHTLLTAEMTAHIHTTPSSGAGNLQTGAPNLGTNGGGTVAGASAGSDTTHNNIEPVQTHNWIIKT